jgi:DNA-binding NarL/FixJ family response regulator
VRVVVAEDSVLFREGLVRLLTEAGHEVVAAVADADALVDAVGRATPDLIVVDVRMPPSMTDDGARVARQLRADHPTLPILLLSQHIVTGPAVDLVSTGAFGYLLKDRVLRVDDFLDAVQRVAGGGSALDPAVVGALVSPVRDRDPLRGPTAREREVLALVAEGEVQQRDLRAARGRRAHHRDAHAGDLPEARPAQLGGHPPARARRARLPDPARVGGRQRVVAGAVVGREPAQVDEAPPVCGVGDGGRAPGAQVVVRPRQPESTQVRHRRHVEVVAEAGLQAADAHPGQRRALA